MVEIIRNDPIAWIFLIGITLTNLGLAWVCMNYAFLARDAARLALRIEDEEDAPGRHGASPATHGDLKTNYGAARWPHPSSTGILKRRGA